jgi:3-dehydroquinate dehydratase/shikimate dehydrogenase
MALICETVMASTMAELRRLRDASTADLVELRLDGVADLDVAGALADRVRPVIATCRASWEGGRFDGSEEARLGLLAAAITGGAEFVDLEWRADRRSLPALDPHRLVLSRHDFDGVPADVAHQLSEMRRAGDGVTLKIACTVRDLRDVRKLHAVAGGDKGRHVVIGMGSAGFVSRVCPEAFGSTWTYGGHAAPGQLSVDELQQVYRVSAQSASTRRFALTGFPLSHSASPAMHNAAFEALGLDAVYFPLESEDARELLETADVLGVEGVSVTAPLKVGWTALGVDGDETSLATGAMNTLRRAGGRWSGRNFDVDGFLAPLREHHVRLNGARCVVLGAGGAARAAAWALRREGAAVEISARRSEPAARLADDLGVSSSAFPPVPGWDLLVNATPAGTWPATETAPVPESSVDGRVVYDLVYHPRVTRLLAWAGRRGAVAIGGLDMLVAQAARQFEYWMDQPAPVAIMRQAAERFLAASAKR